MPVVVVGADGLVGRTLVPMLRRRGSEVRAYIEDGQRAEPLRRMGAKVAVGNLADEDTLSTVMRDAHTACHLAGGLPFEDRGVSARAAVDAATRAGVKRLLVLSYPGASPAAANEYLRGRGLVEKAAAESGIDHLVLRCTQAYGAGGAWLRLMRASARRLLVPVVGRGTQRLAPVFVEDVASAFAAADDRKTAETGAFGLQGPDVVTGDELFDLLAGKRRRKLHLSPSVSSRVGFLFAFPPTRAQLDLLAEDSLLDAPDARVEFALPATSLRAGLARSLGSKA